MEVDYCRRVCCSIPPRFPHDFVPRRAILPYPSRIGCVVLHGFAPSRVSSFQVFSAVNVLTWLARMQLQCLHVRVVVCLQQHGVSTKDFSFLPGPLHSASPHSCTLQAGLHFLSQLRAMNRAQEPNGSGMSRTRIGLGPNSPYLPQQLP